MHRPEPDHPKQKARKQFDVMLVAASADIEDRTAINLAAALGVAVREFQSSVGPADCLPFLANQLAGVIGVKRIGKTRGDVDAQTSDSRRRSRRRSRCSSVHRRAATSVRVSRCSEKVTRAGLGAAIDYDVDLGVADHLDADSVVEGLGD